MTNTREILREASSLADSGKPFVLVTVTNTEGSTPRNPGAKMLYSEETGLQGTVGGGEFEQMVSASAEDHLRNRSCGRESFTLGRDVGQCCGGRMEVFFEFVGPMRRVVIFGAGHVAQCLASLLQDSALETIVVDDRQEWNSPERFPASRREHDFDTGVQLVRERPEATLACVMTCSHDRDFSLVGSLLAQPPSFIGLIGSRSKRTSFFSRLRASGVTEERIKRVHCPIGLGDMGKEPRHVAISIAGQLLLEAKSVGVL